MVSVILDCGGDWNTLE